MTEKLPHRLGRGPGETANSKAEGRKGNSVKKKLKSGQFKNFLFEFLKNGNPTEKIQAQDSAHGTFIRQLMADDFEVFDTQAKAIKSGNGHNRHIDQTARGDDSGSLAGWIRGTADSQRGMRRKDGIGRSTIEHQMNQLRLARSFNAGQSSNQFGCHVQRLKSGRVTGGQSLFGIDNQIEAFVFQHRLIHIVPTGAVCDNATAQRNVSILIHFIYGDQQPLFFKPFADFLYGLGSQGLHEPIVACAARKDNWAAGIEAPC